MKHKNSIGNRFFRILLSAVLVVSLLPLQSFEALAETVSENAEEPLTFTALKDSTIALNCVYADALQYSIDGGEFDLYYIEKSGDGYKGQTISLKAGQSVSFKAWKIRTNGDYHFQMSGKIAASGSVDSLKKRGYYGPEEPLDEYNYEKMFQDCKALVSAPSLPSTVLARGCYDCMFMNCRALKNMPELPALTAPQDCYNHMFYDCRSLTDVKPIAAENVGTYACYEMFGWCTSMTEMPYLAVAVPGAHAMERMFTDCKKLCRVQKEFKVRESADLGKSCFAGMFNNCTSLETVIQFNLKVTKVNGWSIRHNCHYAAHENCCEAMYRGCTKLKLSEKPIPEQGMTREWVWPLPNHAEREIFFDTHDQYADHLFPEADGVCNNAYCSWYNYYCPAQGKTFYTLENPSQSISASVPLGIPGDTVNFTAKINEGDGDLSFSLQQGSEKIAELDENTRTLKLLNAGTATLAVSASGTDQYSKTTIFKTVTVNSVPLSEVTFLYPEESFQYDGSPKEFSFTPYFERADGLYYLKENVDYKVSGTRKATEKGNYSCTIEGIGNYSGKVTFNWKIHELPKQVIDVPASLTLQYAEPKTALKAKVTTGDGALSYRVSDGSDVVRVSKDGFVETLSQGKAIIEVTAAQTKNYEATKAYIAVEVKPLDIKEVSIRISPAVCAYDGKRHYASITLEYKGKELWSDRDYDQGGELSATEIGTYTVTLTGKGGLTGETTATWQIASKKTPQFEARDLEITLGDHGARVPVSVKDSDWDGTLSYFRWKEYEDYIDVDKTTGLVWPKAVGNAKIYISAKATDRYAYASTEINVTVKQAYIQTNMTVVNPTTFTEDGKNHVPAVSVWYKGRQLCESIEYTIQGLEKKSAAGTYQFRIIGKGDFSGTVTRTWQIIEAKKQTINVKPDQVYSLGDTGKTVGASLDVKDGGALSYAVKSGQPVDVVSVNAETGALDIKKAGTTVITVKAAAKEGYAEAVSDVTVTVKPKELENSMLVITPDGYLYDGMTHEPSITVTDGETVLEKNRDYTLSGDLSAKDANTDANPYYEITVSGMGSYTGSFTRRWRILNKEQQVIEAQDISLVYGTPRGRISAYRTKGKGTLSYQLKDVSTDIIALNGKDGSFTVKKAGQAAVIITAEDDGTYARTEKEITVTISPCLLTDSMVSLTPDHFLPDSQPHKPEVTMKNGTATLTEDVDYALSGDISERTDSGVYNIYISGKGNYTGEVQASWRISGKSEQIITAENVFMYYGDDTAFVRASASGGGAVSYAVKDAEAGKIIEIDETSGRITAKDSGTAAVTVTAAETAGYVKTTAEITVTVAPKALTEEMVSLSFDIVSEDGESHVPVVTVVDGSKKLVEGADYKLSGDFEEKSESGSYLLTVNGIGRYTSSINKNWSIVTKEIQEIEAKNLTLAYGTIGAKVNARLITGDGNLKYAVKYGGGMVALVDAISGEITPLSTGTAIIQITAAETKTYAARTVEIRLTVTGSQLVNAMVQVEKDIFRYDGVGHRPVFYVRDVDSVLTEGIDYVLSGDIGPVRETGNYQITVTGTGSYTGVLKLDWKITEKPPQTITAADVVLSLDETGRKLEAELTEGDGVLSFRSADESENVVFVDAQTGDLTVLGAGSAVILVTAAETDTWAETCKRVNVFVTGGILTEDMVKLDQSTFPADGQLHKPQVTVTDGLKVLTEGVDYILSGDSSEKRSSGVYTITVTGAGSYTGTVDLNWVIGNGQPEIWTVTFDTNGGSPVMEQRVTGGSLLEKPNDPQLEFNEFLGWYNEEEFLTKWNFDEHKVDYDTTLYARWGRLVDVSYDTMDHGVKIATSSVAVGALLEKPEDPWEDGYYFEGWFRDSALQNAWNFLLDKVENTMTLFAKWTKGDYIVDFDQENILRQIVSEGDVITLPVPEQVDEGSEFFGWASVTEEGEVTLVESPLTVTQNLHLRAVLQKEVTVSGKTFRKLYLKTPCIPLNDLPIEDSYVRSILDDLVRNPLNISAYNTVPDIYRNKALQKYLEEKEGSDGIVFSNEVLITDISGFGQDKEIRDLKLTYDVRPLHAAVKGKEFDCFSITDNEDLSGESAVFILPVPSNMNTSCVKIQHLNEDGSVKDTQLSYIREMSYNGEIWKYLIVTASSFSAFRVDFSYDGPSPQPEPDPVPTGDDSEMESNWWDNLADGWVMKPGTTDWYFVKSGKLLKGWYFEIQDGKWYYLDPITGRMLTGWQPVKGKWYYLNEDKTPSYYVGTDGKLTYDTVKKVRPYGSMYADEKTPDGYTVGKDGEWVP